MWDGILNGCAWLLWQLANLVGDWGLAILIVTLVIRIVLFPIQAKQYHSSFAMKEMQPKIQKIQEKYAGDQQKISEETMKVYADIGFNPLAGCIPMLIQMPIFIILFQTLRWKLDDIASQGNIISFYNILPDLTLTVPEAHFNVVYCLFALFFIAVSVIPMGYQLIKQNANPQSETTNWMMLIFFGLMFIYMAWISPAGVILYWALSSALGFAQQLITNRKLQRQKDETEAEAAKSAPAPIEIDVERKVKKKRPHKSH